METTTQAQMGKVAWLEKLGLKRAAADLAELKGRQKKLAIAYEHYRFVTPEKVAIFNSKLIKETGKNMDSMSRMEYQRLDFCRIENYEKVPPESVLQNLEIAQERKCFDYFEVAAIKNVKDPLLFGCINGTPNRFFIDQWDNDVSITDLLKENEG